MEIKRKAGDTPQNMASYQGSNFLYVIALGFRGCSALAMGSMPPANRKRFLSQSARAQ